MTRSEALEDLNHLIALAVDAVVTSGSATYEEAVRQAREDLVALGVTVDELDAAGITA